VGAGDLFGCRLLSALLGRDGARLDPNIQNYRYALPGDQIGALRTAARFFDHSADTQTFKRGSDDHNHPGFYRQLGQEPERITAEALQLLAVKLRLGGAGQPSEATDAGQSG
jgi:hypothetical protein